MVNRNIKMVVIPGGCTPYLQAGDIGIFRELKDKLSVAIEAWKNSDSIEYTCGGNPNPQNIPSLNRGLETLGIKLASPM